MSCALPRELPEAGRGDRECGVGIGQVKKCGVLQKLLELRFVLQMTSEDLRH